MRWALSWAVRESATIRVHDLLELAHRCGGVMSLDDDACGCREFIPQVRRPHRCAECGGERPEPGSERPDPPSKKEPARLGPLMADRRPPRRVEWSLDHGAACTCLDCVMRRWSR